MLVPFVNMKYPGSVPAQCLALSAHSSLAASAMMSMKTSALQPPTEQEENAEKGNLPAPSSPEDMKEDDAPSAIVPASDVVDGTCLVMPDASITAIVPAFDETSLVVCPREEGAVNEKVCAYPLKFTDLYGCPDVSLREIREYRVCSEMYRELKPESRIYESRQQKYVEAKRPLMRKIGIHLSHDVEILQMELLKERDAKTALAAQLESEKASRCQAEEATLQEKEQKTKALKLCSDVLETSEKRREQKRLLELEEGEAVESSAKKLKSMMTEEE
jgi:hypothetical protein